MTRPHRGRFSSRQHKIQVNAALRFLGVPLQNEIKPPRAAAVRRPVDGKPATPLEKDVLASVIQALRDDPRVALVDRRQSGVFQDGERYIRVGSKGTLDVSGMLKGGVYFEIECKRPGEKPDERQAIRIARIQSFGGISGYATSAEEALALLP